MSLLKFKSRRLRIPEDHKYKSCIIDEEEDNLLLIFERKNKEKRS